MNRKHVGFIIYSGIFFSALLIITTCKLHPFSTLEVKANPRVYLPLGVKNYSADDYISREKIENMITSNSASGKKARVYDYIAPDGGDQLRYLLHYPAESFDFDMDKYFNNDSLSNSTLSRKFDTKISIPRMEEQRNLSIPSTAINTELLGKFNDGHAASTVPVLEGTGSVPVSSTTITFSGFETITFGSGSCFEILVDSVSTQPVTCTIENAEIKTNGLPPISGTVSGHTVTFPLDDKTIKNTIELSLTVNKTSDAAGRLKITRELKGKIKRATGVTAQTGEITLAGGTINLPLPADFYSATIGEGTIKLSMTEPSGWSGITVEEKTTVTQAGTGGLSIPGSSFQPLGTPVDLATKTLNNNPLLTYATKVKINLNNATYTAEDTLFVTFEFLVKKFSQITFNNKPDFSKTQSKPVPNDMKTWIKEIKVKKVIATVTMHNGLPAGNPIDIRLNAPEFNINGSKTFSPGESMQEYKSNPENFTLFPDSISAFNVTSTVVLPHAPSAPANTFTLNNIETNSTIAFSGNLTFNLDWEEVTIKARNNQKVSFPHNGYFDIAALLTLKDLKIAIDEIPLYFYAGSDSDLFNGTKARISLKMEYIQSDTNTTVTKTLFNDPTARDLKALPAGLFPNGATEYTGDIPPAMVTVKKGSPGTEHTVAEIVNEYPKKWKILYEMSMNEVVIQRAQYDNAKNSGKEPKINVDLLLDMPVGFTVKETSEVPLLTQKGAENTDMFGRRTASNGAVIDTVSQSIDSIELNADINNRSDFTPSFILRAKTGSGNSINKAAVMTGAKKQKITFGNEEWKKIIDTYPFSPDLYLKLDTGHYTIPRGFFVKATLSVAADAKIDYSIDRK